MLAPLIPFRIMTSKPSQAGFKVSKASDDADGALGLQGLKLRVLTVAWARLLSLAQKPWLCPGGCSCRKPNTSHTATSTSLPNNKILNPAKPSESESKFSQGRKGSSPSIIHKENQGL